MSAITIPSVGGIRPSTLPRALVPNDGQTANNILARTSEFRPLQNDLVVRVDSGIDNPKTLYRTARDANGNFTSDMTVNWRADAKDVNYVKGQVNDDKTERTYYTQGDGLAAPRVFSVAEVNPNGGFKVGIDKLLGVPAPATAPLGWLVTTPRRIPLGARGWAEGGPGTGQEAALSPFADGRRCCGGR